MWTTNKISATACNAPDPSLKTEVTHTG